MPQDYAHRALKNSLFMFARMAVVLVIGLYTSRVVLRTLGFEDYGIYNVVGSVVSFFTFLNVALTGATSRFLTFELGAGDKDKLSRTYATAILAHAILALLLVIVLEVAGIWFVNNKLNINPERMSAANWCFQFSVLSLAANIMAVPFSSNILAHERMSFYSLVSIIETVLKLLVVFVLVIVKSDKLIAYSALILAVTVITRIIYVAYCHFKLTDCRYKKGFDKDIFKRLTTFSGYSLITSTADITTMQSRNIFFNWFTGVVTNAAMGIANQVIGVVNGFVDAVTQAIKPQIVKSYASGDRKYYLQLIFSSTKLSYLLFTLISIPVILNIDFLLEIWLGEYPALTGPFILAILLFNTFDVLQQPLWTAIHATGNVKAHELLMSGIKVIAIPLTYITLELGYSPVITLFLWAGLNLICAICRTILAHHIINLPVKEYLISVICPLFIVTLISFLISSWISTIEMNGWLKLITTSLVSLTLTLGLGFFIGLSKKEKEFVGDIGVVNRFIKQFRR